MDRAAAALSGAARAQLASALASLPPGPRVLHVDDDLYCAATRSSPLLALFTTHDALRRAHAVADVRPLSRAAEYCSDPADDQPPHAVHVFLLRPSAAAATQVAAALSSIERTTASANSAALVSATRHAEATGAKSKGKRKGKGEAGKTVHEAGAAVAATVASAAASAASIAAATPVATPRALVLVTPRRSNVVERVLKASGPASVTVRVAVLPLYFLPFDDGLFTLHWPRSFSEVVLEGNNSSILACAMALNNLADTLDIEYATVRSVGKAGAATVNALLLSQGNDPRGSHVSSSDSADSTSRNSESSLLLSADDTESLAGGKGLIGEAPLSPRIGPFRAPASNVLNSDGAPGSKAEVESSPGTEPWFKDQVTFSKARAVKNQFSAVPANTLVDNVSRRKPVTLLVLDRNVDVVTPLLTQWTYEGLLDEAVTLLRGNFMDIGEDEFVSEDAAAMLFQNKTENGAGSSSRAAKPTISEVRSSKRIQKRLRKDGDPVFGQLRDLNYWAAARKLGTVATTVQAYYNARPERETSEIGQVKDYVRGLLEIRSDHRNVSLHTAIAAEISARTFDQAAFKRRFELEREMLDGSNAIGRRVVVHDSIARNEPLAHVLRLCCLWSVTGGGVDAEAFEFIRREILGTYGLCVLPLLGNLERSGLFTRSNRPTNQGGLSWNPFANPFSNFGGGGDQQNVGRDSSSESPRDSSTPFFSSERSSASEALGSSTHVAFPSSVVGYSWQFVRAAMRLMTEFQPESSDGGGLAAAYSGYVPLTVRLIEAGIAPAGWSRLPPVAARTLLLPPGHETGEYVTVGSPRSTGFSFNDPAAGGIDIDAVVLFVGGIARAEASAIRAAAYRMGKKVLIATTDVCGANQFVTMT